MKKKKINHTEDSNEHNSKNEQNKNEYIFIDYKCR